MGFFIKQTKTGFRIIEEIWKPKRHIKTVPREGYPALGFRYEMTVDEAKARAAQINLQDQLDAKKIVPRQLDKKLSRTPSKQLTCLRLWLNSLKPNSANPTKTMNHA